MTLTATADASPRDCLVAVVRSDRDLHLLLSKGIYRIPARTLGHGLTERSLAETRTLALYQTAAITAGLPGAIELWGDIESRAVLPRRAIIPDEPNHPAADELYHVIKLASVDRLQQPIINRRSRRVIFMRTKRRLLLAASDFNELVIGSDAEERLWRMLCAREGHVERSCLLRMNGVVMEVEFALVHNGRWLGIRCRAAEESVAWVGDVPEAWRILLFSPARLSNAFAECLEHITVSAVHMRDESYS
ncbi:MAG: hypothetical protein JST22_10970 [Bacteroidetes bacterium]|nr:hypothetical protein [Bacteroidota bacterium]